MKLLITISVLTTISAIRVPNGWQQQQNANLNNNANREIRPDREQANLVQPVPNYNNANGFINNVPRANGLVANGNLFSNSPADYNNWFTAGVPNNPFGLSQLNSGNLLNNNLNPLLNNGNNLRGKPFLQQPGPPRFAQVQSNFNRRPPTLNNFDQSGEQGQVPYITYTTQGPAPQSAAFGLPKQNQNTAQLANIKQAYPQVSTAQTAQPLTELDFSPQRPFQQEGRPSNQVNNQNYVYSTSAPVRNLDFSLTDPFPVSNFQFTQDSQTPRFSANKPLHAGINKRRPQQNVAAPQRNQQFNPFTKNYRDHRTHEPTQYDPNYDREAVPIVERKESERAPIVKNHEHPEEVPTRPIYPGEGQWAKPGRKHRPFVSKQQYSNLEDSEERPDGYDVFLEGQQLFNDQKQQFGQKLQPASSNRNAPVRQSSSEENADGEIFVPTRLYAQVRHSEDEKHLPPESDENGRLKELIKDTKIQTIYSEEGFEDSAYDHAGHEKKAENTEDFESDEKNEEVKQKKKIPLKKQNRESSSYSEGDPNLKEEDIEKLKKEELNLEDETTESNGDSESSGTHYEQSYLNSIQPTKYKNPFLKSREIKTVTAKDKVGGKIEMEISSEVKAVVQPNNRTKIHKYVTIYPKISKKIGTENDIPDDDKVTLSSSRPVEANRRSSLDSDEIFIEEVTNHTSDTSSTDYIFTTVTPTEYTEIVTMEIPKTTQATTAIPRLESVEDPQKFNDEIISIKNTNKAALRLKLKRRRRRSTPGIPTIEIDTDFIDKINHDIGTPKPKSNKEAEKKYPYYKQYRQKGLHEDSPLRYSEDLKNVPVKTQGKLAFYDLADRKMACSDVNPEVDPVPDKVKNADESVEDEEEDEEGEDPATKGPRLGQLGDKIDCFKMKYFGENPLDNPIFQEKSVGTIKPIFSEIEKLSTMKIADRVDNVNRASNTKTSTKREINPQHEKLQVAASGLELENEIDDGKHYKFQLLSWFPGKSFGIGENAERDNKFVNHFVEKNPHLKSDVQSKPSEKSNDDDDNIKAQNSKQSAKEVQTVEPAMLITTPKYTIELKPKHIYDQIQLLEYLPEEEIAEIRKEINEHLPKTDLDEITTSSPNINKTETVLNKPVTKKKKKKSGKKRKGKLLKDAEESMKMETSDNIKPDPFSESDALQLIRPKQKKPLYEIFDINKYIPKVPKINFPKPIVSTPNPNKIIPVSIVKPTFEVFDINKYLPTTPFPLFKEFITRSTVLPKYKVISEVFYKEDIKPNEQFNVFTDILNNIRNFPNLKDNFPEASEAISVKLDPKHLLENERNNKDYFSSTTTTVMTTFSPKTYASNHKYLQTEDPTSTERHIESILNNFKTNTKPKRRRRIKTTTQETPMIIEESSSTLQYIAEPTDVMGLMPPVVQGYKTIYHPKRDSSQHISNPTIRIEERKINKYFVQGMRPPPNQKVYLYSDFITDNHIEKSSKPKRSKLRRSRRSAQRPAYAQLSRNKTKQPEVETETKKEEDDDYVPHRPKNYHYDEKTGKIVYDKKPEPTSQEEEEEVEYIEVVEETPKTTEQPKQNPVFATATPPPAGQSYTDFVKLLKSASNYHEIPDPTTTEKGAEEITVKMAASTLEPVSVSPPEFLSILAKVRNDSNYKPIEEEKKKTTTPKQEEESEEVEEESQVDNVQNSRGGQELNAHEANANLEIFDISDFLPNIKSYLPKTSVDTSKYKTIERPQMRHRLSSRYNSEQEKDLQNVNTSKQPIVSNTEKPARRSNEQRQTNEIQVPSTVHTTTTSAPEVTTTKIVRTPSRRRTTTARPVTVQPAAVTVQNNEEVSSEASLTTPESTPTAAAQTKSRRRRRRRRPKKITTTPPTEGKSEEELDNTTQAIHRRAERESHMLAAGNEKYEQILENEDDVPKPLIRMEDYVDYEEINDNANKTDTQQLKDISAVAKEVVDVFKNYDKAQRHGGNYKKEDEVNKTIAQHQNSTVVPQLVNQVKLNGTVDVIKPYDKTKKHGGNYKAEKEDIVKPKEHAKADLKDVKKVEIFKDYDKTKKHGGNYRPAPEEVNINENDESVLEKGESIQIENVNIFQDYDKTKKHGGNYKAEKDALKEGKPNIELEKPPLLKNVEVLKDYDKTKKHGGNYKSESNIPEQQLEESQYVAPQNLLIGEPGKRGSVEIFKNYDKTKKHGGNYARENESKDKVLVRQQTLVDQNKDVDIFKNYDENKKTGGNYRREEEADGLKADETNASKFEALQQKRYVASRNDVQRLADVVVKPEAIYSDLTLPLDINALNIVRNLTSEELEEIAESAEIDAEAEKEKEDSFKNEESIAPVVNIGNKLKTPPVIEAPIPVTKKPLFIKDPSKRLYFYAPVR